MSLQKSGFVSNLRDHLTSYSIEQQQAVEDNIDISTNQAINFGNYLIAARKEREWSRSLCAQKAKIRETDLYNLEHGLLLASNIEPELCHKLAALYDEDILLFESLLNRSLAQPPYTTIQKFKENIQWGTAFFRSSKKLRTVILLMGLTLMSLLFNTFQTMWEPSQTATFLTSSKPFFKFIQPSWTVTAVTILLILLWLMIWQGERFYHWVQNRRLRILTSLVMVLLCYSLFTFPKVAVHLIFCETEIIIDKLCNMSFPIWQMLVSFAVPPMTFVLFLLFIKNGRSFIRQLNTHQVQRKLVYVSLLVSLAMPLGILTTYNETTDQSVIRHQVSDVFQQNVHLFFKRPLPPQLQTLTHQEAVNNLLRHPMFRDQVNLHIMPISKAPLLKITIRKLYFDQPSINKGVTFSLHTFIIADTTNSLAKINNHLNPVATLIQSEGHYMRTYFAFSQLALITILYTLIGASILRKGKFVSAFR